MTEIDAYRWISNQPGLHIYVGHTIIRLTIEGHVYADGKTLLDAVIKCQEIIRTMRKKNYAESMEEWYQIMGGRDCNNV